MIGEKEWKDMVNDIVAAMDNCGCSEKYKVYSILSRQLNPAVYGEKLIMALIGSAKKLLAAIVAVRFEYGLELYLGENRWDQAYAAAREVLSQDISDGLIKVACFKVSEEREKEARAGFKEAAEKTVTKHDLAQGFSQQAVSDVVSRILNGFYGEIRIHPHRLSLLESEVRAEMHKVADRLAQSSSHPNGTKKGVGRPLVAKDDKKAKKQKAFEEAWERIRKNKSLVIIDRNGLEKIVPVLDDLDDYWVVKKGTHFVYRSRQGNQIFLRHTRGGKSEDFRACFPKKKAAPQPPPETFEMLWLTESEGKITAKAVIVPRERMTESAVIAAARNYLDGQRAHCLAIQDKGGFCVISDPSLSKKIFRRSTLAEKQAAKSPVNELARAWGAKVRRG